MTLYLRESIVAQLKSNLSNFRNPGLKVLHKLTDALKADYKPAKKTKDVDCKTYFITSLPMLASFSKIIHTLLENIAHVYCSSYN